MAFRAISPPAETRDKASADWLACTARASQTRPCACNASNAVVATVESGSLSGQLPLKLRAFIDFVLPRLAACF